MVATAEPTRLDCRVIYTPQLEQLIRRSSPTIREMERRGELPPSNRFGGANGPKFWVRDEIEAWLAAGCPRVANANA